MTQTPLCDILAIAALCLLSLSRKIIYNTPLYFETKHDIPSFEVSYVLQGVLAKSK